VKGLVTGGDVADDGSTRDAGAVDGGWRRAGPAAGAVQVMGWAGGVDVGQLQATTGNGAGGMMQVNDSSIASPVTSRRGGPPAVASWRLGPAPGSWLKWRRASLAFIVEPHFPPGRRPKLPK